MARVRTAAVGRAAEGVALDFLRARRLELVCRNFRCRAGEIDLVMRDGECLVFVEVRYRRPGSHARAAESVDARKRRKLAAAAAMYLALHPHCGRSPARFDVVALDGPTETESTIQWLQDAFRPA